MHQLTIFDFANEYDEPEKDEIVITPRTGIIRNQVSIYYKGCHIANARICGSGLYEVRPRLEYFASRDSAIQTMSEEEIAEFSKRSFVHYEVK